MDRGWAPIWFRISGAPGVPDLPRIEEAGVAEAGDGLRVRGWDQTGPRFGNGERRLRVEQRL